MPLYQYFRNLFEKRRNIKRKVYGFAKLDAEVSLLHAQRIIEYFGPKEQINLTPEQMNRVQELANRTRLKLKK